MNGRRRLASGLAAVAYLGLSVAVVQATEPEHPGPLPAVRPTPTPPEATGAPRTAPAALGPRAARSRSPLASRGLPQAPLDWAALAECESGGRPRAVSPSGRYRGLFQFSLSTWHDIGETGDPIEASPERQLRAAQRLFARDGRAPWPVCGKRLVHEKGGSQE